MNSSVADKNSSVADLNNSVADKNNSVADLNSSVADNEQLSGRHQIYFLNTCPLNLSVPVPAHLIHTCAQHI
jgi:hypothetical protein